MTTRKFILVFVLALLMIVPAGCRRRNSNAFVIALGDNIRTIDPIGSPSVDAASERLRTLIFNSLVKKDERFDYTGELASNILRSDDGLTFSFTLRDGVKFHDGRVLSSADVKYTLDLVFSSNFAKSASFFEGTGDQQTQLHQERRSARCANDYRDVDEAVGWSALESGSSSDHSERQLRVAKNASAWHWSIQVC